MTLRAAVLFLSAALLPAMFSTMPRAEGPAPAASPPQASRPAGGLLSHSFSDVVEDNFGLPPERPEASPEAGARKYDPAVPAPGRLPR